MRQRGAGVGGGGGGALGKQEHGDGGAVAVAGVGDKIKKMASGTATVAASPRRRASAAVTTAVKTTTTTWEISSAAGGTSSEEGTDDGSDLWYQQQQQQQQQTYQNVDGSSHRSRRRRRPHHHHYDPAEKSVSLFQLEQPRLEDIHTAHRKPLHVPDNLYRSYLLGRSARRSPEPLITQQCCGATCAGFSVVAVLFLLFVGFIFDRQPLYIKGCLTEQIVYTDDATKPLRQYLIPGPHSSRMTEAESAYGAAAAYLVTAVVSFCVAYPEHLRAAFSRNGQSPKKWWNCCFHPSYYQDIPDVENHQRPIDGGVGGGGGTPMPLSGVVVPMGGVGDALKEADDLTTASSSGGPIPTAPASAKAYEHTTLWDRAVAQMQQWMVPRYTAGSRRGRRKRAQKTV